MIRSWPGPERSGGEQCAGAGCGRVSGSLVQTR